MGYKLEKTYSNGVVSNYAMVSGYKVDRIDNTTLVTVSYFAGTERTGKKPVENVSIRLSNFNFSETSDIIDSIYSELNKISPYKEYIKN